MNTKNRFPLLAAATLVLMPPSLATAGAGLPLESALTGAPGCEHVIDLLMRCAPLEGQGDLLGGTIVPSPHGSFILPASDMGDLCIASVSESAASDPACAPTFVVAITNHSQRAVCNVQVSLVALLGPIKACDPTANACLSEVPAGATVEIEITLPAEALNMGSNGGVPVGFNKLLVAIDSLDELVESNESNNLRLLCRNEIPRQAIAAPAPTVPVDAAEPVPGPQAAIAKPSLDSALEEFGIDGQGETTANRL